MHFMRRNILRLYKNITKHSRRTSNVAKSEDNFESCEVSVHQNKASINAYKYMSANPPSKRQTPLGMGLQLQRYKKISILQSQNKDF